MYEGSIIIIKYYSLTTFAEWNRELCINYVFSSRPAQITPLSEQISNRQGTYYLNRDADPASLDLYNSRHSTFDAWLSQARNQQRLTFLLWCTENREEPYNPTLSIGFFHEMHCDTPPCKNRTDNPEVRRNFETCTDTAPI